MMRFEAMLRSPSSERMQRQGMDAHRDSSSADKLLMALVIPDVTRSRLVSRQWIVTCDQAWPARMAPDGGQPLRCRPAATGDLGRAPVWSGTQGSA